MRIDRIFKKDDIKVFVILDNDQKLLLSKDIVYKYGLRKNDELTEENISDLLIDEKKLIIKQKALSLLKRRPHSRKELLTKLRRHFSEVTLIEQCLSDLADNKLIDDLHFAEIFIEEKLKLKKWSKSKFKSELILKGISKDIIADCLERFFNADSEKQKAFDLVNKKLQIIKSKSDDKKIIYQKLLLFLQSRGYDYDLANEVISESLKIV